jgi:hypothetical protein
MEAVVSFGGGSYRFGSHVLLLLFFSQNTACERKRENHFVSHRLAYLRFIVLWVLPQFFVERNKVEGHI